MFPQIHIAFNSKWRIGLLLKILNAATHQFIYCLKLFHIIDFSSGIIAITKYINNIYVKCLCKVKTCLGCSKKIFFIYFT